MTVTASDGELSASQDVAITLTDVNEAPVITSAATVSVEENGTAAFTATATDVDGDTLTYTLSGADAALFTIDAATGEVSFLEAPDFETPGDVGADNVYDVTVTASDGELSSSQDVAITVTDLNEVAPIITSMASFTIAENQTSVFTATATDDDSETLTYSLTGVDATLFTIDASSGAVSFLVAPDFDNPADTDGDNIYDITVAASDGELIATQDVAVSVVNINNLPIVTTEIPDVIRINEGQSFVIDIDVFDFDNDSVSFRLFGPDRSEFDLNNRTGEISFNFPLLFDPDTPENNFFSLSVRLDDGSENEQGQPNFVFQELLIEILDLEDVPPFFSSLDTNPVVFENRPYSDVFNDNDLDGEIISLSLAGEDAAFFTIEPALAGFHELQLVAPLDFENPQDTNGDNIYVVDVVAFDGVNTTIETVELRVANLIESENAPIFTTSDMVSVEEGERSVFSVNAEDLDGETVTYSIALGGDGFRFDIDSVTGELSFNSFLSVPIFRDPQDGNQDNIYEVTVQADDGTENTTTQTIFVEVVDVEFAPVITPIQGGRTVRETEDYSLFIEATDEIDGQILTFSLEGADAAFFQLTNIVSTNGLVRANIELIDPLDFENPLDADGDNIYNINIVASDGVGQTVETHTVRVLDIVESSNAPIFETPNMVSVVEGADTIIRVNADDADGDPVRYRIVDGEDSDLFSINAFNGDLEFNRLVIFDESATGSENFYTVEIEARDGNGGRTFQTLTIEVLDGPNMAPEFFAFPIPSEIVVFEGRNFSESFRATDFYDNQPVTVTLSGPDAEFFTLNFFDLGPDLGPNGTLSVFGAIELVSPLDFESRGSADGDSQYQITITVSDGELSSSEDINVIVRNLNEAPVFETSSEVSVEEGQTTVATVFAEDPEGDSVTYGISSASEDGAFFIIDRDSGEISFANPPDFENPQDADGDNIYSIRIFTSDGRLTDVLDLEITVTDNPSDNATAVSVSENVSIANRSDGLNISTTFNLTDAIILEFADQALPLNVFEPAQVSLSEDINPNREHDIWTVKSVTLETEIVSTEPDTKPILEDIYSTTDEDGIHFIEDTNDFAGDVWI